MDMDKRIELVSSIAEKLPSKKSQVKKVSVGFCGSPFCSNNSTNYRDIPVVWPHENLTRCPKCKSEFPLVFKKLTPQTVERLKAQEKVYEERLSALK